MAGALSSDLDWSDDKLTQLLFTHVPTQVPHSFKIVPLPSKISSYVTSLLLKLPMQQQYNKEQKPTTIGHGNDGANTAKPPALEQLLPQTSPQRTTATHHMRFLSSYA